MVNWSLETNQKQTITKKRFADNSAKRFFFISKSIINLSDEKNAPNNKKRLKK